MSKTITLQWDEKTVRCPSFSPTIDIFFSNEVYDLSCWQEGKKSAKVFFLSTVFSTQYVIADYPT